MPQARHASMAEVFPLARDQVLRSLATLAGVRNRDLAERLDRQIARMTRYYAELRTELAEQAGRSRGADDAAERLAQRRQAIEREEQVRSAELRQKHALHVQLRLLQVLVVEQPKLLLSGRLTMERWGAPLELVWDPLLDCVEAPPCPTCGRPGYSFRFTRLGRLVCPACPELPERKGGR